MLELEGVSVAYDRAPVLHHIDLVIAGGSVVSLLGPSGSGKSTLLRVVAGLERPLAGTVRWDGRDLADVPPHRRGFGLMFQDLALFPHRDVLDNVAFGPRMQGRTREASRERAREVLELVGLTGMERRAVSTLSGGEQQRVALARSLAPGPALLMLDEPLGSLDRALREALVPELRAIFATAGATVIHVTHDQDEALGIADRTVILRDGRVEADGSPETLWERPPSVFVARFLGYRNLARARIAGPDVVTPWGALPRAGVAEPPAGPCWVLLRPDRFVLAGADAVSAIAGRVRSRRFQGDHVALEVDVAGAPPLEVDARWSPLPGAGSEVRLALAPGGLVLIPEATGETATLPP
jgi:thiamine transport system ATP-binding protein